MKLQDHCVQADFASPLGRMILCAADDQLVGAWFADQSHLPDLSACARQDDNPVLQLAMRQLHEYFAGIRRAFDLPLNIAKGTAFQQTVWQALRHIAHGSTCSYAALSASIGNPTAVRAVGAAVGRNPISIILPCHRVLGSNGQLTGYAGGFPRKAALLQLEGAL